MNFSSISFTCSLVLSLFFPHLDRHIDEILQVSLLILQWYRCFFLFCFNRDYILSIAGRPWTSFTTKDSIKSLILFPLSLGCHDFRCAHSCLNYLVLENEPRTSIIIGNCFISCTYSHSTYNLNLKLRNLLKSFLLESLIYTNLLLSCDYMFKSMFSIFFSLWLCKLIDSQIV